MDDRFRWIPLHPSHKVLQRDANAEVQSIKGQSELKKNLVSYGLPDACRVLSAHAARHATPILDEWANSVGKTLEEDLEHTPGVFRLEPGPQLRPPGNSTALLTPLFTDRVDVVLCVPGAPDITNITVSWDPINLLHLPDRDIKIEKGRITFVYTLYKLSPRSTGQ
ncbi:hypothetical protein B0T10DRAFT_610199 [Thelonectria olida]|uniref:Uncharacterized protein n=1 Tax=Thelonectria olida TaxID=1576542 RepID=A0A9P8VUD4_9HYPO|nr:hypothetical protein B0T10DRAFT_610199 [Thelonectria olida]